MPWWYGFFYIQHATASNWLKKKKKEKSHKVLGTNCTQPIIKFWSCKYGLWFKRIGFYSLSAVKGSTQLSIKATTQAQTAGIQLLALFSPSVGIVAVCAEHWNRLKGTGWEVTDRTGTGPDCCITAGPSTPQVHNKWGKPRQWQMDTISNYLSPCRAGLSIHVGPPHP